MVFKLQKKKKPLKKFEIGKLSNSILIGNRIASK